VTGAGVEQPPDTIGRARRGLIRDHAGLWLAGLAGLVRLAWVLAVPTRPVGDFAMYMESAAHLVEHGALDGEFIYMPGYVLLLAGLQALGGGLWAAKLVGVLAGVLATGAVYGITVRLFDRTSAVAAGLLCALWPAGIAVASVTGTDMPAAALLVAAVWLLLRDAPGRPWRAAVLFGVVMGLAAYVRAVALPLTLLAACYWAAVGTRWRAVLGRTALGCAVAFLVLLPWGIRNRVHYGELFFTDSHGGHTALVGANPNSDGVYSRSLNQMFWKGTGYRLFAPPHRDGDRAAYALARRWAQFEPDYALGLLGAKADRLLTNERPLLYWPIYRQGVLPAEREAWFARHRPALDGVADGFWYLLVAMALMGVVVALSRRLWPALSLLPMPVALCAVYVVFFSEVRYHLAIAVLLIPFAGVGVRWAMQGGRDLALRRFNARGRRRLLRETLLGALAIAVLFLGWPRLVAAAAQLRDRHRWAVSVCEVVGQTRLCQWRATIPESGEGLSPLRGVWNGFGLKLTTALAGAATDLDVAPGRYRISVVADTAFAAPRPEARLTLHARGGVLASTTLPAAAGAPPDVLAGVVDHMGGNLRIELVAERLWPSPSPIVIAIPPLWVSDIKIESDLH
jgi:4-amino-4-deoxy-L-arabinose transferase-like glycosyltransferase